MNIRGLPFLCAYALFILGFQYMALALNPSALATGHFGEIARLADLPDSYSPLVVWLIERSGGGGRGIVMSSLIFAMIWMPVVLWTVLSRFKGWMRYAILTVFLVLVVGFTYDPRVGGFAPVFHATRWGWGLAILALSLGIVRGSTAKIGKLLDIGALALIFVTLCVLNAAFIIALAPVLILGFYCNRRLKTLGIASVLAGAILVYGVLSQGSGLIEIGLSNAAMNNPFSVENILTTICLIWMPLMVFQSQKKCDAVLAVVLSAGLMVLMVVLPISQPYWALLIAVLLGIQSRGVVVYNRWGWKMKPSLRMLAVVFLLLGLPNFYASIASLALHALHDPTTFETVSEIQDIRILR